MSKKNSKPAISAKLRTIIGTAATVGYDVSNGFEAGVALVRSLAGSKAAMNAAAPFYKAGHIVRRLEADVRTAKAWGNMNREQRIERAIEIQAKATPDSAKPDRRTELEHKAVRAADVSWATCKRRAGIIAEKTGGRKPRPASKATSTAKAPPVDLVKASPRLSSPAAANDYMATAAAALLATVNKNAKHMSPALSSAVADFHAALKKEGLIK